MTNTERIQANNAALRECIETAENLPDAGSGGEDVTAETAAYTEKMQELETAITALETELEGKAAGSGGVNVETCTVTVKNYLCADAAVNEYQQQFAYVDGSLNTIVFELPVQEGLCWNTDPITHTFTVAKGTLIYNYYGLGCSNAGNNLTPVYAASSLCFVAIVNGDCTINIG